MEEGIGPDPNARNAHVEFSKFPQRPGWFTFHCLMKHRRPLRFSFQIKVTRAFSHTGLSPIARRFPTVFCYLQSSQLLLVPATPPGNSNRVEPLYQTTWVTQSVGRSHSNRNEPLIHNLVPSVRLELTESSTSRMRVCHSATTAQNLAGTEGIKPTILGSEPSVLSLHYAPSKTFSKG